jgi:hypothetical protein
MTVTEQNKQPIAIQQVSPYSLLFMFLLGRRTAIIQCWQMPRAWVYGLILVLTAGLAREYDAEYLLAEPWHLLLPVAASLVTSFVLYLLIYVPASTMGEEYFILAKLSPFFIVVLANRTAGLVLRYPGRAFSDEL